MLREIRHIPASMHENPLLLAKIDDMPLQTGKNP